LADGARDLMHELPHLIVLGVLVLVLLVVVTNYNWIHCSQIPGNWCEIYCNVIMRTHSRVALVYGEDGIGDPDALENTIRRTRPYTYLEPVPVKDISFGMLKGYKLAIVERARSMSKAQTNALLKFIDNGGTVLWVGDSGTRQYYDQVDIADAIARAPDSKFNETGINKSVLQKALDHDMTIDEIDNFTQRLIEKGFMGETAQKKLKGFGEFEYVFRAKFVGVVNVTPTKQAKMRVLNHDNLMARGLFHEFDSAATRFAEVKENAAGVDKVTSLTYDGKDYPALLEAKDLTRVIAVYSAVPLEDLNSTTMLQNILDYLVPC
jgi:hypothetical protein